MNYFSKKVKILGLIFFIFSSFLPARTNLLSDWFPLSVGAQQTAPQFLVSWQTNSFVPSWYGGKAFPTTGSRIDVKFDLIDNGKVSDLSKTTVRWYINDNLVANEKNGLGIKSYTHITNDYVGNDISVRISIPNYNGSTLDKVIDIPIISPEVIINNPHPNNLIAAGKLSFEAIPFFFNVNNISKLSFLWNANDQPTSALGNKFLNLSVDAVSGSQINLSVMIKNIGNELETASKNVKLMVK